MLHVGQHGAPCGWRFVAVGVLVAAQLLLLQILGSLPLCGAHNVKPLSSSVNSNTPSISTVFSANSIRTRHHHCIHDEQLDAFYASIDPTSIQCPQRLAPVEIELQQRDQSAFLDDFLRIIGLRQTVSFQYGRLRSLEEEAPTGSSVAFQPIRITFDLSKLYSDPGYMCVNEGDTVKVDNQDYKCTSGDVLTAAKKEFIVSVLLPAIRDRFQGILSVQRVIGNLIIGGISCTSSAAWACCSRSIPASYRSEGVANADFVLHVTARPTTGATIAWALPCNTDQYGRPISGQANFGPGRLDPTTPASRDEQIGTALHEMTHALVLSKALFYHFRQPRNGNEWGYENVVTQTQAPGGVYVSKIVTPNVVKQVKQHFNCFNWVGAGLELENGEKGSASYSSHWEKRMVMNEYMSATSSYDPVYSAFTLALFEDSGWYEVSYSTAETLPWGYLEGCGMAQSRCSEWNDRYICKDATQKGCTSDYTSKGYCNVASYSSSIPSGFQYFQDPTFGGRDSYADYCPFFRAYSNGDCRNIGRTPTTFNADNWMEEVSSSSKCFSSSLSKSSSDGADLRSTCYKVAGCTSKSLKLSIGGVSVHCPIEGATITVNGFRGKLVCPPATKLCQMMQDKCSGAGVLLTSGKCQCNPGYVGDDCSGIACPKATTNGEECGGSSHGTCKYTIGKCVCTSGYTGLTCSELVCPQYSEGKNTTECSGHGTCDRDDGVCTCSDGYSGEACECVPGCTNTSCGDTGTCDCTTGACSCNQGHSGVTCSIASAPTITTLSEEDETVTDVIGDKEYKFYKIYLNASTYDITFVLSSPSDSSSGVDVDLYGSFDVMYPTSLTSKTILFSSNNDVGMKDEINLCGSLGMFPRGLNDSFRYCPRATSSYMLTTPGYFYLSVLGYSGGSFALSIETDKCKGVTCSNHGGCGINYPGICTCDRYWSGEDCSVPVCGPDCEDLGTCGLSSGDNDNAESAGDDVPGAVTTTLSDLSTSSILSFKPLRNTSECYGNGICQVQTDANGNDVPGCVCDEAFSFANPTASQALCKELIPSIAYIQHFTEPFTVTVNLLDLQVDVGSWALYTLEVKDSWEILVANLAATTSETDPMLFIRKEKLPSVNMANQSSSESYIQFMDSDSWTSGLSTRKIVLSRATSTLSSGLYYIGVYNSLYAQTALGYQLTVNTTGNCSTTRDDDDFGICLNGATCNAQSSQMCTCPDGYAGKYCSMQITRSILSSPANSTSSPSNSYLAYNSTNASLLGIGAWTYFSFEIDDVTIKLVQFRLVIENDLDTATPVLPLLLVRGPKDDGFPTLFTESQRDFSAIEAQENEQVVSIPVETTCSFATDQKHCYKVAIYNRQYSGDMLLYRLEVELFTSLTSVYPLQECGGAIGNAQNCHNHGKCVLVNPSSSSSGETQAVPSCSCFSGWTGLRCNTPTSFDMQQLWSAISNVSLLCSTCSTSFSLARGEVKMFRVPESLRENTGVRLRVTPSSTSSRKSGVNPSVYVSEMRPRSIYDFTHISIANDFSGFNQVLSLSNASFTGHFWVVVYSDYPTQASTLETNTSSISSLVNRVMRRRLKILDSPYALRMLADSSDSSSATINTVMPFQLIAEVYALSDGSSDSELITERSFFGEVCRWLVSSPAGIAVLVFSLFFLVLIVSFCLWRICHAPENQDKHIIRFFGANTAAAITSRQAVDIPNVTLAPLGSSAVVDSPDRRSDDDMELAARMANKRVSKVGDGKKTMSPR